MKSPSADSAPARLAPDANGPAPAAPGWHVYEAEFSLSEPAAPRLPLAFEASSPQPFQGMAEAGETARIFYLEDQAAGLTVAELRQPIAAPAAAGAALSKPAFGQVQLAEGLPAPALHCFFEHVEIAQRGRECDMLRLRGQPFCHEPAREALLAEVLRRRDYRVAPAELTHHLDLTQEYSFGQQLAEYRRAGLHVEQEPPLLLPLAYDFMQACRRERGQAMEILLPHLQELFRQFPRVYSLFSVREPGGNWAALAVAAQVSGRVLSVGPPFIPPRAAQLPPAMVLYEGLHAFGRASGLRVLDLGTSSLTAEADIWLLELKQAVGGVAGLRLSWEKRLLAAGR